MSETEIEKIVIKIISKINASGMKDMGKVMGQLKSKHSDTLDFSKVSTIIKELLN